jgi:hypothetical protein
VVNDPTPRQVAKPKAKNKSGTNAIAAATKLKQIYGSAVVSATELVKTIHQNVAWRWAFNDTMLGGIQTAQNKLEDIVREDALASKFISQDMAESMTDYKDGSEY